MKLFLTQPEMTERMSAKGESRMAAETLDSAAMQRSAVTAPMLRPHSTISQYQVQFFTQEITTLRSQTSLIPRVTNSPYDLPLPVKSKLSTSNPHSKMYFMHRNAVSLEEELPWRKTTRGFFFQGLCSLKKEALIFNFFLLKSQKSLRQQYLPRYLNLEAPCDERTQLGVVIEIPGRANQGLPHRVVELPSQIIKHYFLPTPIPYTLDHYLLFTMGLSQSNSITIHDYLSSLLRLLSHTQETLPPCFLQLSIDFLSALRTQELILTVQTINLLSNSLENDQYARSLLVLKQINESDNPFSTIRGFFWGQVMVQFQVGVLSKETLNEWLTGFLRLLSRMVFLVYGRVIWPHKHKNFKLERYIENIIFSYVLTPDIHIKLTQLLKAHSPPPSPFQGCRDFGSIFEGSCGQLRRMVQQFRPNKKIQILDGLKESVNNDLIKGCGVSQFTIEKYLQYFQAICNAFEHRELLLANVILIELFYGRDLYDNFQEKNQNFLMHFLHTVKLMFSREVHFEEFSEREKRTLRLLKSVHSS